MEGDRRQRLRESREIVARATAGTDAMRARGREQRDGVLEMRRRREEHLTGDVRVERLWPAFDAPEGVEVRSSLPRGCHSAILLCGVCDEVLAVGTYAADLRVALRCPACLSYNVRQHADVP